MNIFIQHKYSARRTNCFVWSPTSPVFDAMLKGILNPLGLQVKRYPCYLPRVRLSLIPFSTRSDRKLPAPTRPAPPRPDPTSFCLNVREADQPAPEVLYLCTTCGRPLQSDEDGRWRRRRRPTSAPPQAGRRDTFFDHTRRNWQAGETRVVDLSRATAGRRDGGAGQGDALKGATSGGTSRRLAGLGEGTAKLKYAPCARIIQHAYRDFRHRQYLRGWASALVRALFSAFCGQTRCGMAWHDAAWRDTARPGVFCFFQTK